MTQLYLAVLSTLLCLLTTATAVGQTITIDQGGTVSACGATFGDAGGSVAPHGGTGSRQEITLCADPAATGTHIQLQFTELAIAGTLTIYNGSDTGADVLRTLTRAENGERISLAATAVNASGCLTVVFESTGTDAGWLADVNCIVACQSVVAELASSDPAATPLVDGFIDVCVGETITLAGRGRFPENNTVYSQTDATSDFRWSFQNGDERSGQTVTYAYTTPGAYTAELYVTDDRGCINTNRINQRIRVAPPPNFAPGDREPTVICAGESVSLTTAADAAGGADFVPVPREVTFSSTQTFSEQISIPDRQDEVYASALDIQLFDPGQQMSSGRDIQQICVTIEHSFLGDLDMWIECPDGTRLTLLDKNDGQGMSVNYRLGYGEVDGTGPEPAETYCFTADAAQSVYDYISGQNTTGTTRLILPFDRSYLPKSGDFDDLTGCALNGEWRLNVVDNFVEDDGTVVSWEITFADDLVPENESFTVPIVESSWVDAGNLTVYSPERIVYTGTDPGFTNQRLRVRDDFGCSYDTLIRVEVTSPLDTACFACDENRMLPARDTQLCLGESVAVDFRDAFQLDTTIRWMATERREISAGDTSSLNIRHHLPSTFSNDVSQTLSEVCVNLSADVALTGTEVRLRSPGGRTVVVVPRGSVGTRDLNACFSVLPRSSFDLLAGQAVNGEWTLLVDDGGSGTSYKLDSWSMELTNRPEVTYSWSPAGPALSCTDCPDPIIAPSASEVYRLTATSAGGCAQSLDYRIDLRAADVDFAVDISDGCAGEDNGAIILSPRTGNPIQTYSWSNGAVTRDITDLAPGGYDLTVTTVAGCDTSFAYVIEPPDSLVVTVDTVTAVSCFGEPDGSIFAAATGGYGGYTYAWSDAVPGTGTSVHDLLAGTYGLTVTDVAGCTGSVRATVPSPDELTLDLAARDVSCRGGSDGQLETVIDGGTAPFRIRWSDGSAEAVLAGLPIGTYEATITDANGCTASAAAAINQPEIPLSARVVNEVPGCFDTRTNRATVLARGGNEDYRYLWSNGETGLTAFFLPAGENTVAVTDKSGCVYEYPFTTESRPEIIPTITEKAGDECRDIRDRTLEARASVAFLSYAWSTGANGSRITDLEPDKRYTVTLTDAEGCRGSADFTTASHVPLEMDLAITPVTCFGERNGSAEVLSVSNRYGTDFTYVWGANTNFATGPIIRDRPATDYLLTLTDAIGCSYDTLVTVPGPTLLRLEETIRPITCSDAKDGLLAIKPSGGNGNYRFAWSSGANISRIETLGPGKYTVTVTDAKGCAQTQQFDLAAPPPIDLELVSQGPVCGGEYNGRIDVLATGGLSPLQFSINDQRFGESSTFAGLGGGTYVVHVRDRNGCTAEEPVTIDDGPSFSVDLGEDREITFGDSLFLTASVAGGRGTLDYFWWGSYDGTLSCADCPSPLARPEYEIDYRLELMDSLGCAAEDMVRVRVRKIRELAVPTAFTPNEDGHNDRLLVHGRPGTRVLRFSVFDRWGDWIWTDEDFRVNDREHGWDGKNARGTKLDSGVYVFKVEAEYEDGSREIISGQTTLIR